MKWTLLIMVCSVYTAKCEWKVADTYFSEERCVMGALMIPNLEYKCRIERVPLPRPRPKGGDAKQPSIYADLFRASRTYHSGGPQ